MDRSLDNIINLQSLWKKYGSRTLIDSSIPEMQINISWPHRCWFDKAPEKHLNNYIGQQADSFWLEHVPKHAILPIYSTVDELKLSVTTVPQQSIQNELTAKGWKESFKQTAMYLPLLKKANQASYRGANVNIEVKPLSSKAEIDAWVIIVSEAFGYKVDPVKIKELNGDADVKLLMGWQGERAVACGLLYKTGQVIGIHQVGVKTALQGQGIARAFMNELLAICVDWHGVFAVLQASVAGRPLYDSLGFIEQFTINNYRHNNGLL